MIHIMFPTRSGHKNAGFRVASFSLILFFFSPDFIHLSSAFFLCSSACSHTYQPQDPTGHKIRQVGLSKWRSFHLSSTETPGPPAWSLTVSQLMHPSQHEQAGKGRQDAHPVNTHLARPTFPLQLEDTQLLLSLLCYKDPPLPPKPCC